MAQDYVPPKHRLSAFNCPNCGAFAHQRWQMRVDSYETASGGGECRQLSNISASICARCREFTLWEGDRLFFPPMYVAPLPSADMPEDTKEDYEEARSIFSQSPRGAAALLRLAIQKLVITLGESGDNLNESIGNLVKKGLRVDIQKALDIVRVVGNNAVHPGELNVDDNPAMALSLFKLTNLIVEDMITKPKEVSELFDALPEGAKDAIAKRDRNRLRSPGANMDRHPKVNPPNIAICPHCGNKTPHKLLHRQDFTVEIAELLYDECWWAILECSTCGKLSLYKDHWDETRGTWTSKLIHPVPIIAPIEAPENIQQLFREAVLVKPFSPSLCVVGIRRCLEAICNDQGATERALRAKVRELASKQILPERLVEMMNSSRIIGNLGAHAVSAEVTDDDAQILIDFCSAILEYVYVAPTKIATIQKRLDSLKGN